MKKPITVIGASNKDIRGITHKKIVLKESNPAYIKTSTGGVGRNIAENLSRLGIDTVLLSAVGNDINGNDIIEKAKKSNINVDHMLISDKIPTGTYIALLDNDGEMFTAVNSMEIINEITIKYLKSKINIISNSEYIITEANLNIEVLKYIIDTGNKYNIPVCIDPVSATKAKKLTSILNGVYIIKPNVYELSALVGEDIQSNNISDNINALLKKGVKNIVLTNSNKNIIHADRRSINKHQPPDTEVTDVTGAGDAFTAGLMYGLYKGHNFNEAVNYGIKASIMTLQTHYSVNPLLNEYTIEK